MILNRWYHGHTGTMPGTTFVNQSSAVPDETAIVMRVNRHRLLLINSAFWLGLALLVGPDLLGYVALAPGAGWPRLLLFAGTVLDAALFTTAFLLFRAELLDRLRAEAALRQSAVQVEGANRELAEANAMKSKFLHVAAHDLRNPLQTVSCLALLIPEDLDNKTELIQTAEHIRQASREMLGIIEDLLQIARLQSGKVELSRAPADLAELAEDVVDSNQPQACRKNIRLEFRAEGECVADVEARTFARALDNLVSNAIKFSPRDKCVRVVARRTGDRVNLVVEDEGAGISPDDMRLLYEPFQRLSARPTAGESSTGLGLSIVKGIVEAHRGRVWAESAGPDRGSIFSVELPASELTQPTAGHLVNHG